MKFKTLLFLIALFAGVFIASMSAFATYFIIGVPIGWKMVLQIMLVIACVAPLIYVLSFYSSRFIATLLSTLQTRLLSINAQDFTPSTKHSRIVEINEIHTMLNTLSQTLQANIETLKTQNSEKETMLYSIAHDFRTPLTIIKGYVEEFQDGIAPEEKKEHYLATIQKEVDFLEEIITNILSYLQSVHPRKTASRLALKPLLETHVLPLLKPKEGVTFCLNLTHECSLVFDKLELVKVFFNLLSNALKFTDKGVICVYETPHALIVEDAGIGINEAESDKIFEPFYTTDNSKNTLKTGIGLGLSIVKNLLLKHGYTIVVDTSFTQGARFVIFPVSSPYMAP